MYDENFNKLMKFIFKSEGGYSNHKNDPGGATNYGITQDTYNDWNKKQNLPQKDVKNITKKEALDIYYNEFWKKSGADKIKDLREAYILFDTAVNCGIYNAKQMYKKAEGNYYEFLKERKKYYDKCIKNNNKLECFRQGWDNRIRDLENNANEILNSGLYTPPYQNEITIYDKEYKYSDVLDPYKINKKEDMEQQKQKVQNARNKYLYLKHKEEELKKGTPAGFAAPINHSTTDSFLQGFYEKDNVDRRTPSQKLADEIDDDKWDDNDIAFLEGFNYDQPDKHLISEAKKRRKQKAKQKGNKGKGPNGEDGYWYTTKIGKHVFVPED